MLRREPEQFGLGNEDFSRSGNSFDEAAREQAAHGDLAHVQAGGGLCQGPAQGRGRFMFDFGYHVFTCVQLPYMRCYTIVRHIFGQPYHRNTWRNWHKAYGTGGQVGPRRGGDQSFLLFVGACIKTWNRERKDGIRRVSYYEIFNSQRKAPRGQLYRYPKVPRRLFRKLVASKFPPPMMAVACCDLVPMNLLTKGERYSFSKRVFAKMLERLARQDHGFWQAIEIANAHFLGDTLGKTRNVSDLLTQYSAFFEAVADQSDFYDTISDERCGFAPDKSDEPQPTVALRRIPEKDRVPGTKVHNIEFHGGFTISRRMAAYWRGSASKVRRAEYARCCDFIRSLLKTPLPTGPSTVGMASTVPLFNALLALSLRAQNGGKRAGGGIPVQQKAPTEAGAVSVQAELRVNDVAVIAPIRNR